MFHGNIFNRFTNDSIAKKTCDALSELGWIDPTEAEKSKGKLKTCEATMIVNFGPEGKCRPGLITGDENLEQMIVKVFTFYEEESRNRKNQTDLEHAGYVIAMRLLQSNLILDDKEKAAINMFVTPYWQVNNENENK